MEMKLKFNNVCCACGRTRGRTEIKFDPVTLSPYCAHMSDCNDHHPNSYASVAERNGEVITLVNFKAAGDIYFDRTLNSTDPLVKKAAMLLETPTTIRVGDERLATYLVHLQESRGFETMTKTIVTIIKEHWDTFGDPKLPERDEPAPKKEPSSPVVSAKPAPVFTPEIKPIEQQSDEYQKESVEAMHDDEEDDLNF